MEALTPWHLLLILLAVILLFGYKKLPDASRSVGRSLRIFKSELRAMPGDEPSTSSPPDEAAGPAAGAEAEAGPAALPAVPSPAVPSPAVPSPAVPSPEALEAEAAAAEELAARLRGQAAQHMTRAPGG